MIRVTDLYLSDIPYLVASREHLCPKVTTDLYLAYSKKGDIKMVEKNIEDSILHVINTQNISAFC